MKHNASPFSDTKFTIKAILIDLDGTLIDTAPEIARAANEMLTTLQLSTLPTQSIESFIGEGAITLIKRCLNATLNHAVDDTTLATAQSAFFTHYAEIVTESQPYPQVASTLKKLKSLALPLACITNKPNIFTEPLLKFNGLFDYFDLVISGDTLPKKKPAPDQIFHACKQFGIEPWDAVLIGDSNTDILAAKNAGCYVFTVPYGYNQGLAIDATKVDAKIRDLNDAINCIQI